MVWPEGSSFETKGSREQAGRKSEAGELKSYSKALLMFKAAERKTEWKTKK